MVGSYRIKLYIDLHLCFWIFMGSCTAYAKLPIRYAMAGMLILAYAWEAFERHAEVKWPQYWLHPESWYNSYISDILMGRKYDLIFAP